MIISVQTHSKTDTQ